MKIKAIISDLDGTLADTEKLHIKAWNRVANEYGFRLDLGDSNYYKELFGLRDLDFVKAYASKAGIKLDDEILKEILLRKSYEYKKLTMNLSPAKCVTNLMDFIKIHNLNFAIVTSSMKIDAFAVLSKLNINYDVLITSDDVNKVKPDQEPILKALNMLKVMPEETIGIGDTIYDRESYKKAGLENIFILNCNNLNCFESICDVIDVIKKKYF
ncbi:MAG: hypothetical protein C0171_02880 [Caldisphaera sp.]|jgi:HAD superfamily hydrolase (TIGR01509 family)|nr:HAD hydrolase-like protein [Caldisphaera sp.]PMP91335.1 MAG: hypothetical protein C0171_02880 [Caldisphaera sp.]